MIKILITLNELFVHAETSEEKKGIERIVERTNNMFDCSVSINNNTISGSKKELFYLLYELTRQEEFHVKIL